MNPTTETPVTPPLAPVPTGVMVELFKLTTTVTLIAVAGLLLVNRDFYGFTREKAQGLYTSLTTKHTLPQSLEKEVPPPLTIEDTTPLSQVTETPTPSPHVSSSQEPKKKSSGTTKEHQIPMNPIDQKYHHAHKQWAIP
jgi:hypothetical protein